MNFPSLKTQEVIRTRDGFKLQGRFFSPVLANGSSVLIVPAVGVPQGYYGKFAAWLAEKGYAVHTFDYRGVGASRPPSLKGFKAEMHEWGKFDLDAAIRHVKKTHPHQELIVIAHSIGGQILGLSPACELIDRTVMIGSQHPYWFQYPLIHYPWLLFSWFFALPILSRLFGYYPGKLIRWFSDLPKGVALEWGRWCRAPEGLFSYHSNRHYGQYLAPTLAINFTDDRFAPPNAFARLRSYYPEADFQHEVLSPTQAGVNEMGHFGFFRKPGQVKLWDRVLGFLQT